VLTYCYDILVGTANFGAKAIKKISMTKEHYKLGGKFFGDEHHGTGIELIKC
jgi:hypothetical protein